MFYSRIIRIASFLVLLFNITNSGIVRRLGPIRTNFPVKDHFKKMDFLFSLETDLPTQSYLKIVIPNDF